METSRQAGVPVLVSVLTIVEAVQGKTDLARLKWVLSRLRVEPVSQEHSLTAVALSQDAGGLHGHKYAIDALVAALALRARAGRGSPGRPVFLVPWSCRRFGVSCLDVFEDRSVGMAGDEAIAVGSRREAVNDVTADAFEGGEHGSESPDQEGRRSVLTCRGVAAEQEERSDPGQLHVTEREAVDRLYLRQLLVQGDRGFEIFHVDAGNDCGDAGMPSTTSRLRRPCRLRAGDAARSLACPSIQARRPGQGPGRGWR